MIKNRWLVFGGVVLILIASISMGRANRSVTAGGGSPPALKPWTIDIVDTVADTETGLHTSLVFNLHNEKPYISYYDATNQDLRYAYPTSINGNCGPNNAWRCETIDSEGDVGQYSSLDYYYHPLNTNKTGIAYYDATNLALKIAIWSCPTPITCGWNISTIAKSELSIVSFGSYTSLKFNSQGVPYISYRTTNSLNNQDSVSIAYEVESGGNCGEDTAAGKWQCETVEDGNGLGVNTSLAMTSNDVPIITHYDYSPGQLRLCDKRSGMWSCLGIDASGKFSSLALDSADQIHIAYYNETDGHLRYAQHKPSDANCGMDPNTFESEYRCETIDSIGDGHAQVGIAITLDAHSYPIIAYKDAADTLGYPTLNIARPSLAFGNTVGNCGPIPSGGIAPTWQCDVIDNAAQGGGAGYLYEADYTAIDIDAKGLAYVAYHEYDDYHSLARLKIAYQFMWKAFLPTIMR